MSIQRAPFSADLQTLRGSLKALLPQLQGAPDWYVSIYGERKSSQTFSANLKQTQMSDQVSMGVIFRIYDGFTLFEEATDDLQPENLRKLALEFKARVSATARPKELPSRKYTAPSWGERLMRKLDPEITSQLPKQLDASLDASTPVHFGIRFEQNPWSDPSPAQATLAQLKKIVARAQQLAPEVGLKPEELTYVQARQGLATEESFFLDSQTDMSQTLYRLSLMVITMAGAERTFIRMGGLGGLEAITFTDEDLRAELRNLKALKDAGRLPPGKYRVLFGPVLTGVLAHEAFGHAQEGDTCARGRSKAWELHKTGQSVGNQHATILNNPAVFENAGKPYAAWGSYFFDEEGWLAEEQTLLDQGRLCAPMTNLTSALRLGIPRSANGKRESWANGVYTRQTNTYFSPGEKTVRELMTELGDGFLAMHPAGGMEDPKGMGIQVGISFLEEIKGGKPTGRIFKGPAGGDIQLTGYTPDILHSIVAKSKIEAENDAPDVARHPYNDSGGCGKYHKEFVYAGCGGPYMLLDQVTLG